MIQMEGDVCSNYEDEKLPILDLKVWTEEEENRVSIKHEFYQKPMASKNTLRAQTAYPRSQLRAIMVEEVLRRLRNCHPDMAWTDRGKHVTNFANEMKNSGHKEHFRNIVINKATNKFSIEHQKHKEGEKDLYRSREQREKDKEMKGGKNNKDNWYKKKKHGNEETATSVLRVPYTNNSKLKKLTEDKLKRMKAPLGTKTSIVEGGGNKLKDQLIKLDPFPKDNCGKEDCSITNCKEKCFQAHVNYNIICKSCENEKKDIQYVYMGESSRGCYIRGKQHFDAYRNKHGFMYDHDVGEHGGRGDVVFQMERVNIDSDPMRRIIRESIRIRNARKSANVVQLMNRKEEYFGIKTVEVHFEQD